MTDEQLELLEAVSDRVQRRLGQLFLERGTPCPHEIAQTVERELMRIDWVVGDQPEQLWPPQIPRALRAIEGMDC